MQAGYWNQLRSIFEQVSDLPDSERGPFLDQACEGSHMRRELDAMLAVDLEAPQFLDTPAPGLGAGGRPPLPGSSIMPQRVGSYRILRPIASGGMGSIYAAEQDTPRRTVALKMMRFGFFSESSVRRFRDESELLARMHHPGIAQVFEAGVFSDEAAGIKDTPYFAMEYVAGSQDILEYARESKLSLNATLELFMEVCEAVHYGHQRGVIHRDLKPGNILVGEDGHPKVIDFGVARATDADMTARTLATRTGELIGTLFYMSPEQLSGDPNDVDTRSDVYALGIVLYQLLCQRMPYDLDGQGLATVALAIREKPPIDPQQIQPSLSDDLSWVLCKALEKEPDRRYASASEFAGDLRRFLDHEPVAAGPPTAAYRLRKFVRRNRLAVGAASAIVAALVTGIVLASTGLMRAASAAELATTEAAKFRSINQVLTDTLTAAQLERDGPDVRVVDMLDRASERIDLTLDDQPEVRASMRLALGQSYLSLGHYDKAESELSRSLALWEELAPADPTESYLTVAELSHALVGLDRRDEAGVLLDGHVDDCASELGMAHDTTLTMRRMQAALANLRGDWQRAETELRALAALSAEVHDEDHPVTLTILSDLQGVLVAQRKFVEAESVARKLLHTYSRIDGEDAYTTLQCKLQLASIAGSLGNFDEADELYTAAVAPLVAIVGAEHPSVLDALTDQALVCIKRRRPRDAVAILNEILPVLDRSQGTEHRVTLRARQLLATAQADLGDLSQAQASQREIYDTRLRIWGPEHNVTLEAEYSLARILIESNQIAEGEPLLMHCLESLREEFGVGDQRTLLAMALLSTLQHHRQEWDAMVETCQVVHAGFERLYGEESAWALNTGANLAVALGNSGRPLEAISILEKNLVASRAVLDPNDPAIALTAQSLAAAHIDAGHLVQAEEHYIEALEYAREHLPEGALQTLECLNSLASCTRMRGRPEEAEVLFLELLDTWHDRSGRHPLAFARHRQEYGRCLLDLGRYDEAESEFEFAYEVFGGGAQGTTNTLASSAAKDMVEALELAGETERAQEWRGRIVE